MCCEQGSWANSDRSFDAPPASPLLGHLPLLVSADNDGEAHHLFVDVNKKYGDFSVLWSPFQRLYIISSPIGIRAVS
jgi:hypothetical protein